MRHRKRSVPPIVGPSPELTDCYPSREQAQDIFRQAREVLRKARAAEEAARMHEHCARMIIETERHAVVITNAEDLITG
jgi:hypothetical protein